MFQNKKDTSAYAEGRARAERVPRSWQSPKRPTASSIERRVTAKSRPSSFLDGEVIAADPGWWGNGSPSVCGGSHLFAAPAFFERSSEGARVPYADQGARPSAARPINDVDICGT
jgi:hypothetical protein